MCAETPLHASTQNDKSRVEKEFTAKSLHSYNEELTYRCNYDAPQIHPAHRNTHDTSGLL